VVVLLLGAGCSRHASPQAAALDGGPAGDAETSAADGGLSGRVVVSDRADDWSRGDRFRVADTRDLYVRAEVPALPEQTVMSLQLVAPDGAIYLEEHAAFTTGATPVAVASPWFPEPRMATPAEPIPGGYALTRLVPILGGPLQRTIVAEGVWQVTVRLEGVPAALTSTVVLYP